MKNFVKAAIIATGVALASQATQAAFTINDLYVGFNSSSASADLVLNVGLAGNLFASPSVVDLSGYFTPNTFNSVFASGFNGVNMSVIGANTAVSSRTIYISQLRAGGAGDASVAGSSAAGGLFSSSAISGAASAVSAITTLPGTVGTDGLDSTKLFTSSTAANTATSVYGKVGLQPQSVIGASGIIYEDLWKGTTAGYTYQGYFTFNANDSTLSFTSSTVAVPEPTTYGMLAGAGLLALSLRRQFSRKTA